MDTNKLPFPPRRELDRFESYQPGLSIEQIKRQYNLKSVIKLASNENSLGPSKKALAAYDRVASNLFRYPETRSVDLRRLIATRHRLDMSQVIVGSGSDEIIELLAKAFLTPEDDIVVSASAFIQYRLAAHLMGSAVITVPMVDFKHDLKGMARAATKKTKFAFVANPNNPTSTYNTVAEMEEFFGELPAHVIPVIDEAYFEYASFRPDYPSVARDFFKKRPVVVLRTFSKIHGLAGLRVGYGLAPEPLIQALDKIRPPFNVSVPAQAAAADALLDEDHVRKSVEMNEKEKKIVTTELEALKFSVLPSATNFLLFKTDPHTGRQLFEKLLHQGVIARCVDEYKLPNYLRVTLGKPDENKIFLKALKEVLKNS